VVDKFAEIEDALAVGQKIGDGSDEHVLLFVKMKPATAALTDATVDAIRTAVKTVLSPRHVPAHIHQVADIPYTVNGKKVENLVRDVVAGKKVTPSSTVTNPECLYEYRRFRVLGYEDSKPKL
jgi:acetoacetyl-CoA synthetase